MTNAVGRMRWKVKNRRSSGALPREHDFGVTSLGVGVLCVVIAVMFSV